MGTMNLSCCGLQEISGISSWPDQPERAITHFITNEVGRVNGVRSGVIFTSAGRSKTIPASYASALKDYIEEHNLGTVQVMNSFRNKNSGNYVITFLWIVKRGNLAKWYKAQ